MKIEISALTRRYSQVDNGSIRDSNILQLKYDWEPIRLPSEDFHMLSMVPYDIQTLFRYNWYQIRGFMKVLLPHWKELLILNFLTAPG